MTTELLPCPFCGGEAGINYQIDDCDRLTHYFEAQCAVCDATGPPYIPRANAIAAWNRRASVAAPPREPTNPELLARAREIAERRKNQPPPTEEEVIAGGVAFIMGHPAAETSSTQRVESEQASGHNAHPRPTDALTDQEVMTGVFASRQEVTHTGTFPQRLDYDRALYRYAYRAGFAARASQPQSPGVPREREVAWLIEAVTGQYWCGGKCGWTPSPNLACRFASAEDAMAAREWLRIPPVEVRITEHVWIDARPQEGAPGGQERAHPPAKREVAAPQGDADGAKR